MPALATNGAPLNKRAAVNTDPGGLRSDAAT